MGLKTGFGDDFLWIGGIKLFADGALGSQTAYMYSSYPGRRGYCGVATSVGKALRDQVAQAARAGLASWIHAIGDRANHEALMALAGARRVEPTRLIHRVEHAQCVRSADVRRFARLGVIASMQPCHLPGDIALADRYWPRARQRAYPFRSLLTAGAPLAFGSDVPVETMDPIFGIHAAVNRQDRDGQPAGGWYPAERSTVRQALAAYTVGAARAGGRGGRMGRLSPGVAADIVLLSEDVLRVPARHIKDLRVVATVFDGRVVYRR
jgi:predicted amidohydrolase YtcJ